MNFNIKKSLSILFSCFVVFLLFCLPIVKAQSLDYDIGFDRNNAINLSVDGDNLTVGQSFRIYATVYNFGNNDVSAHVLFFDAGSLIGQTQPVSLKAGGSPDEVYLDWIVPDHEFQIYAELKAFEPEDQNTVNNAHLSEKYYPQKDSDGDGINDNQDVDDDNDGVSDIDEIALNTDPFDADTDGDGCEDDEDQFPLDETKCLEEKQEEQEINKATKQENNIDKEVKKEIKQENKVEKNVPPDSAVGQEEKLDEEDSEQGPEIVDSVFDQNKELLTDVKIKIKQLNWNSFDFSFITNLVDFNSESKNYTWEFGDNEFSNENTHHVYDRPGNYTVKLKLIGPLGNAIKDRVNIQVTFWSVYNFWLWLVVAIVIIFMVLFLIASLKSTKQMNEKTK